MSGDLRPLEALVEKLENGWSDNGSEIVPDHVRRDYIEATFYPGEELDGIPVRIWVEVVEP